MWGETGFVLFYFIFCFIIISLYIFGIEDGRKYQVQMAIRMR